MYIQVTDVCKIKKDFYQRDSPLKILILAKAVPLKVGVFNREKIKWNLAVQHFIERLAFKVQLQHLQNTLYSIQYLLIDT